VLMLWVQERKARRGIFDMQVGILKNLKIIEYISRGVPPTI
jgi:hypothetical protein